MKTVHFVYVLPRPANFFCAVANVAGQRFLKRRLVQHRNMNEFKWPSPLRAPHSITYNVARLLARNYQLQLYDLTEQVTIDCKPGDILIGHAWPDPDSIMWRSLQDTNFEKRYLIGPYNHDVNQVSWMRPAVELCDRYFAICGDYWKRTHHQSPFVDQGGKMVYLNMAVDTSSYPMIKHKFNKIGSRRFFYIGRAGTFADEKGLKLLEEIALGTPGFEGGYICAGAEIKGWNKICDPTKLTPRLIRKIAAEYDVFINMSRADAQATTVLEAMSWGFPVACTFESGYCTEESLFYLKIDDSDHNIQVINTIQNLPEGELDRIARKNRRIVEQKYNWDSFLSHIENYL